MRHKQTRVGHSATFFVHGNGIRRNADVTRGHRARDFFGGGLVRCLPHLTRNDSAAAAFELHHDDFLSVGRVAHSTFVLQMF